MKKKGKFAMLLLAVALLSGCSLGSESEPKGELVILSIEDEITVKSSGMNVFQEQNPDMNIRFINAKTQVDDPYDAYLQFGEIYAKERPDVVISDALSFGPLASQNAFVDLSARIQDDEYPIDDMYGAVLDWIRHYGGGGLTGLAPAYDEPVIAFNIELFERYGVPQPTDGMSWKELLELARRFPDKLDDGRPLYGYHGGGIGELSELVDRMAETQGIAYMNWEQRKVTADTDQWKQIYELAIAGWMSGSIYPGLKGDALSDVVPKELFLKGQTAMLLADYAVVSSLSASSGTVQWGIVTQPVDSGNRGQGNLTPETIFSVSNSASNPDTAWAFVRHMNSEEQSKRQAASGSKLSTRIGTNQSPIGLEPFHKLAFKPSKIVNLLHVSPELSAAIGMIRREELDKAAAGEKTIEEALRSTQERAEAAIAAAE